ncbi:MAG TPA: branched-chain amino acid ABC transporter substrate-binding protein [Actinomycetota bacterium]|jgi:ABC-type branched-subunit amino acid transport system substrate-binding protein|nr:branched-chain amino acid ABC transporter substrate-binding protein [Actinomycetota bacterium]
MHVGRHWKLLAGFAAFVVVFAGCSSEGGGAAGDIKTDVGVTAEPCPGSTHQDRGCIYLGILSDLTEGPFRALGVTITDGNKDFWKRVNAGDGIGGKYDVDVTTYTRDNKYNPQEHVAKLREILPNVLALAQSLGTPMTIAAKPIMDENDLVAAPASLWSGWSFEDLVLESAYNYCIESINGLDWAAEEFGKPDAIMAIHYPGDYGGDSAAGVANWAKANDVDFPAANNVQTLPNAAAGNQDQAVGAILKTKPDVAVLATGPAESAEIIGKAVAQGFAGRFMGNVPTYNPALLQSQAAEAIKTKYNFVAPLAPWGSDDGAHDAMKEAVGDKLPANDFYALGWIASYPLKALLEKAVSKGDLTRAGLRGSIDEITVDYEGALPRRNYKGDANDNVVRTALIGKADAEADLGWSVVKPSFTGKTAQTFEFTEACQAAG